MGSICTIMFAIHIVDSIFKLSSLESISFLRDKFSDQK